MIRTLAAATSLLAVVASARAATPDGGADAPGAADGPAVDAGAAASEAGAAPAPVFPPLPPPPPPVLLRGRVLERGTRRALPGATISVDEVTAGETDADGRFELRVPPGPHRLRVHLPAHEPLDKEIDATPGAAELEVLRLTPRPPDERYETVIQAGKPEVPQVAVSGEEARKTPGAAGDPFRVIGSLPGVSQIVWPAALYVVRGANPGNTGFFLDGVKVPALFHLGLGPSVIHPYLIEGVDFMPGGYPASYGRYVSGIVAARSAAPPTDRAHGSADVTVYDAGGIVTSPWDGGRGSVAVAARYSYTGALFSLLQSNTTLRYGDYQLRVDHPLGPGRLTVFAFGSLDELGWTIQGQQTMEYAALQFHRVTTRWQGAVGGGRLLAGVTVGTDRASSTLFGRPIKVRAFSAAPRLTYERSLGSMLAVEAGADGEAQSFTTEVPPFQMRQSDLGQSRRALSTAVFATATLKAGRRLVLAPGVRGDFFAEEGTQRFVWQPRLNLWLRLTEALAVKVAGGRFAQMPSLPVSVPGFESFGLQSLGLQTALGGSVGLEAALPRGFTASVTGYYQKLRVTDIRNIDINETDPTAPGYLVARDGLATGAELLVRRTDQSRLYGWLAYTLSWSFREDDNGVLGKSDWDQRHIFNVVAGYRLGGGYTVGARAHYHTGRTAPIIDGGGLYRQLPAFYQLDLRAERRFVFDRFILDVYADFANATLTREVFQLRNETPFTGDLTVVQDSFKIILPTIGVHGEL